MTCSEIFESLVLGNGALKIVKVFTLRSPTNDVAVLHIERATLVAQVHQGTV